MCNACIICSISIPLNATEFITTSIIMLVCVKDPLYKVSSCSIEDFSSASSGLFCCKLSNRNNKLQSKNLCFIIFPQSDLIHWQIVCMIFPSLFMGNSLICLESYVFLPKAFCLARTKFPGSNLEHLMSLSYILVCLWISLRLLSWVTLYTHLRWLLNLSTYFWVFTNSLSANLTLKITTSVSLGCQANMRK